MYSEYLFLMLKSLFLIAYVPKEIRIHNQILQLLIQYVIGYDNMHPVRVSLPPLIFSLNQATLLTAYYILQNTHRFFLLRKIQRSKTKPHGIVLYFISIIPFIIFDD